MTEDKFKITLVPTDRIRQPFFQCRDATLNENLDELVDSIKTVGLLEPLTVRIDKEKQPELVIGSRRWKACQKASLHMVPVIIRELTDEQALEIEGSENLNRNDLSADEKTRLVSEWAKHGYDANGIAKKVHKSYTWVTSFLPTEFKDKVKAEAGKLGGEARAATIIVAKETLAQAEEKALATLVECHECKMGTRSDQIRIIDEEPYCPKCAPFVKRVVPKEPEKPASPKSLDTPEQKLARMHPQKSRMEEELLVVFGNDDLLRPVVTDRSYPIVSVTPDFVFPRHNLAVFLDGKEAHANRQERDSELREKLFPRHGLRVLSVPYSGNSDAEKRRIIAEIKEAI